MTQKTITPLVRWLHLSDFHVGKDGYEQGRLFEQIVQEVSRWRQKRQFDPHFVFLTGDIANKGVAKEYEVFRSALLNPLQSVLGPEAKIIPVPGNHDVARPSADALARQNLLDVNSRFFDASKEGRASRDQVIPRFKQYKKLMSADISPDWLAGAAGAATLIQEIGSIKVGIAGLNTAWLSKDDSDKGFLTPGYRLVDSALQQIGHCDLKIVLGHHPLSWMHDREEAHIRTIFARHNVIYLHGHMHRSEGRTEEGGSDNFLVLQAGAAFQARDADKWVNGFLWGEADLQQAEVRVSPRYWDSVNREWPPQMGTISQSRRIGETDWWRFQLPGRIGIKQDENVPPNATGLSGWILLTDEALREMSRDVTPQQAEQFFDGAEPDWSLASSPLIPVREQAKALLERVAQFGGKERPQLALVRGPTAEGKSTALRQVVVAATRRIAGLKVLWHLDETQPLVPDLVLEMAKSGGRWLIASDHGDLILHGLRDLALQLKRAGRGDIQLVVASHDSDWRSVNGDSVLWGSFTYFEQASLGGLSQEDAMAIAKTWAHFGVQSFTTNYAHESIEALASRLVQAAADEEIREGALLGALLSLRHGSNLREHVRKLLLRLDSLAPDGRNVVGLAFRLIASMHSEGMYFLSRPVLAEALQCDRAFLQSSIIRLLATEAAGGGGVQLRTRHRKIACAAVALVEESEGDCHQLFVALARAAITLGRIKGVWLGNLSDWEYGLAKHFAGSKRLPQAVEIAKAVADAVPSNAHYAVNLAQFLRESGDPAAASKLLQSTAPPPGDRALWCEWGTCCGLLEDYSWNAWFHSYSLSDQVSLTTPSLRHAREALTGLAKAFEGLHDQYGEVAFADARSAVTAMAMQIHDGAFGRSILQDHAAATSSARQPATMDEALELLSTGLAAARDRAQARPMASDRVGDPVNYTYAALVRRVGVLRRN